MQPTDVDKSQFLFASACKIRWWSKFVLDRLWNKPRLLAPFATGTNSLHQSSHGLNSDLVCFRFPNSFPTDYMPSRLPPLRGVSLSTKIAALRQLTFVHDQFLERGQEVSQDLVLMSQRNFS